MGVERDGLLCFDLLSSFCLTVFGSGTGEVRLVRQLKGRAVSTHKWAISVHLGELLRLQM